MAETGPGEAPPSGVDGWALPSRAAPPPTEGRADTLRTGVLGLNFWLVAFLIPWLTAGREVAQIALGALPLAVLPVGLGARRPALELSRWLLLVGYPGAIGLAIAAAESFGNSALVYPWPVLLISALALTAYVAAAMRGLTRPERLRPRRARVSAGKKPVSDRPLRRWLRRIMVFTVAGGGLLAAAVAPMTGDRAALTRRWGETLDDALVLASTLGGIAAALGVGAIVGPALRATRVRRRIRLKQRRTTIVAVFLGSFAGLMYLLLSYFDGR